jgi:hypothetical protein
LLRANGAKFDSRWWARQLFDDARAAAVETLIGDRLERAYTAPPRRAAAV